MIIVLSVVIVIINSINLVAKLKKIDSVVRNVFSTRNLLLLSLKSRMNQKLFRKNQGTKTLKQMGNLLTRARLQEILLAMEMWKIY